MRKLGLVVMLLVAAIVLWLKRQDTPGVREERTPSFSSAQGPGFIADARVGLSKEPVPVAVAEAEEEIMRIAACYEGGCSYPDTDPGAYGFAVGQELRRALLGLRESVVQSHLVHPQVAQMARAQLENSDGHVQAAAIDLLATQPPSGESLEAILKEVIGGFDENLISAAMKELGRYPGGEQHLTILNALADAMLSGSPVVGHAVAKNVDGIMKESDLDFFEKLRERLPEGGLIRAEIEGALARVSSSKAH